MKDYRIRKETTKSGERFVVEHFTKYFKEEAEWGDYTWYLDTIEQAKEDIDGARDCDKQSRERIKSTEIIEY